MLSNKCTNAGGNYLLKNFSCWGTVKQLTASSKFPATVDCFFVLHLLVNSVIILAIARNAVERVFIRIRFFSYLGKQGWLFTCPWLCVWQKRISYVYISGLQTLSPCRSCQGIVIVRSQIFSLFRVIISIFEMI